MENKKQNLPKRRLVRGILGVIIPLIVICIICLIGWAVFTTDFSQKNLDGPRVVMNYVFLGFGSIFCIGFFTWVIHMSYSFMKIRIKKDLLCMQLTEEEHESEVENGIESSYHFYDNTTTTHLQEDEKP